MNLWLCVHQSKHQYCILHKYLAPIKYVLQLHPYILCKDHMDSWSSLQSEDVFFRYLSRINLLYNHLCKIYPNVLSSIYFLIQVRELHRKYKSQRQLHLFLYQGINKRVKVWSMVQGRNNLPYWLQQLIFDHQKRLLKKAVKMSLF